MLLFVAQNLDAMDGKHAKRTMNYSSMGELFGQVCPVSCEGSFASKPALTHPARADQ